MQLGPIQADFTAVTAFEQEKINEVGGLILTSKTGKTTKKLFPFM